MYHIELRQFPHNMCKFNLSERELFDTIVAGWAHGQWIEMGERKWNPHQSKLTVLEGPEIPIEQLSIGRGWSNAQHHSEDVTERVIAQARQAYQPAEGSQPGASSQAAPATAFTAAAGSAGESAAQLSALLGSDPAALLQAWRLSVERRPELTPSESLALAEATLRSLDASER